MSMTSHASSVTLEGDLSLILLFLITVGVLGGPIRLHIWGILFRWTGSWFGGQATVQEVKAALAWASIPEIVGLVLWLPLFIIYGNEVFARQTPRTDALLATNSLWALFAIISMVVVGGLAIILGVWSVILFLKCLGEVHRFSVWRALAAVTVSIPLLLLLGIGGLEVFMTHWR